MEAQLYFLPSYFEKASEAFVPPNPKLLDSETLTSFSCAEKGI